MLTPPIKTSSDEMVASHALDFSTSFIFWGFCGVQGLQARI